MADGEDKTTDEDFNDSDPADTPTVKWIDGIPYMREADGVWRAQSIEKVGGTEGGDIPVPGQTHDISNIIDLLRQSGTGGSGPAAPIPGSVIDEGGRFGTQDTRFVGAGTQEGQQAIDDAMYRVASGRYSAADVRLLKAQGLITASDAADLLMGEGGLGGSGGSVDPYAGARDARAERALQEQIRAQRIAEVENAQAAIEARTQAAQQARLEGAQFAVTPSMRATGHFPGLSPTSPIVRQGLADPFSYQPIAFNPERGVNINEQQVANDLAMIRRAAGA